MGLFHTLSKMFNNSESKYLICYHGPKLMIDRYKFNVELVEQTSTSMHGSSENHMGYLYKRVDRKNRTLKKEKCDPLFADAKRRTAGSIDSLSKFINEKVMDEMNSCISRRTRSHTRRRQEEERQ